MYRPLPGARTGVARIPNRTARLLEHAATYTCFSSLPGQTRGKEGSPWTLDPRPTGSATIALQRRVITRVRACHHAAQQIGSARSGAGITPLLMTGLLLHPVTAHPPQERCPRLRVIQKGTDRECSPAHRRRSRLAVLVPSGSAVFAANAVIVDGADEPLTVVLRLSLIHI